MKHTDPTYDRKAIDADPVWKLAFKLSEYDNDDTPVGWSRYIAMARCILEEFDLVSKYGK